MHAVEIWMSRWSSFRTRRASAPPHLGLKEGKGEPAIISWSPGPWLMKGASEGTEQRPLGAEPAFYRALLGEEGSRSGPKWPSLGPLLPGWAGGERGMVGAGRERRRRRRPQKRCLSHGEEDEEEEEEDQVPRPRVTVSGLFHGLHSQARLI